MLQRVSTYSPASMILDSQQKGAAAKPRASASGTTTGTTSSGTTSSSSTDSIGSTFLSLLVQELQNQDPTDPMDSTAMVGQMISLNQLDQLISINQAVGGSTGSLNGAEKGSSTNAARSAAGVGNSQQAQLSALPFNPNATQTKSPAV